MNIAQISLMIIGIQIYLRYNNSIHPAVIFQLDSFNLNYIPVTVYYSTKYFELIESP